MCYSSAIKYRETLKMKNILSIKTEIMLKGINKMMPKDTMAEKLGVSRRTIRNWFGDTGSIKLKYADKIDKLYDEVVK